MARVGGRARVARRAVVLAVVRARRDGVGGHDVAGAAAADRVHGRVVLVEQPVALELLVEAEDGALARRPHVASAAATAKEALRLRLRRRQRRRRCRQRRRQLVVVADAAAARGVVAAGGVERRGLGDHGHCGGGMGWVRLVVVGGGVGGDGDGGGEASGVVGSCRCFRMPRGEM